MMNKLASLVIKAAENSKICVSIVTLSTFLLQLLISIKIVDKNEHLKEKDYKLSVWGSHYASMPGLP